MNGIPTDSQAPFSKYGVVIDPERGAIAMASQFNGSTGIPNRDQLFTLEGGDGRLTSHLAIKAPDDAANTPPVLSFKRKREVEIPWAQIFKGITDNSPVSVSALRAYFEDSWGLDDLKKALSEDPELLFEEEQQFVQQIDRPDADPIAVFRTDFSDDGKVTGQPVTSGFLLKHGGSGRLYHIVEAATGLAIEDFKDWTRYDQTLWTDHVQGVELVFATPEEAAETFTDFEEVDLRPAVIERKFGELDLALVFATQVKGKVSEITDKLIEKIVGSTLDADEIESLQRRVLRLQIGEQDAQRAIDRLVSQAASLGFVLLPKDGTLPAPKNDDPNATKKVPAGLYSEYTRTARWTTSHSRTETYRSGWWIFGKNKKRKVPYKKRHERKVLDYRAVDTSKDLLSDKRQDLAAEGMQVFVFDRSPDGFVTLDGTPLRQVMARCDFDEEFRRHCAVVLPVYEDSLLGDRIVAKYSVFKRPLPGILPTMLPRLALEESLSYRIAWQEMQLGEMVNSINLAPGEDRKVTMTKTFTQKTTVSRSTTSVFDISQSETSDLATEMENQTRQESQQSDNLQFSAKATGSYGFLSAEATASGGTTHSLGEVSQAISKVARKAARSVSQQNREEVSSTSTAQTEISNTDETTATLSNINQGRSLNLMFYRLYNKFSGGLFLDDLGFSVIPGVELIAGSGVHDSHGYSLRELTRLMHEFDEEQLPFDLKANQRKEYSQRVLDSIQELLRREYIPEPESEQQMVSGPAIESKTRTPGRKRTAASEPGADQVEGAASAPRSTISVGLLRMPASGARVVATGDRSAARATSDGAVGGLAGLSEFAEELLGATIQSDEPMVPQDLLVAAPGLYLDAVVGSQPGTEPYSEEMRAQEVRMRAADVFARESEALYQRAQAMHLAQMVDNGTESGRWITGIMPMRGYKTLRLALSEPLPEGNWHIRFDGMSKAKLDRSKSVHKNPIQGVWPEEQDWLRTRDLISRIDLFDEESGTKIDYPA